MANKIILEPKELKKTLMNPMWVSKKSKEELADLLMSLAREIHDRVTTKISNMPELIQNLDFKPVSISQIEEFIPLPKSRSDQLAEEYCRMMLSVPGTMNEPVGIEVRGQIVFGRGFEEQEVDFDLTEFGGEHKGVSRRHAILQTINGEPYISDTASTNGTHINGNRLGFGVVRPIDDGDVISFGALHIKVMIINPD